MHSRLCYVTSWGSCGSRCVPGGDLCHDAVDLVAVDGDVWDDEPAARACPSAPAPASHPLGALGACEVALIPQEVPHPPELRKEIRRAPGLGHLLPPERNLSDRLMLLHMFFEKEWSTALVAPEYSDVTGLAHLFFGPRLYSVRKAQRCASVSNVPGRERLQIAAPRSTTNG